MFGPVKVVARIGKHPDHLCIPVGDLMGYYDNHT